MSSCCPDTKATCTMKAGECTKDGKGSCKTTKICKLKTPEGEFDCECICTCKCSKEDCRNCDCKCNCTMENAKRIETADGVKYRCECVCKC